jgi:hypothetical protein
MVLGLSLTTTAAIPTNELNGELTWVCLTDFALMERSH